MRFISFALENFRNHKNLQLVFPDNRKKFIFFGKNGSGKTNILEAMYILSLAKSFRSTDSSEDFIQVSKDYSRIKGEFFLSRNSFSLEVFNQKRPKLKKAYKVNGVKKSIPEFIGNFLMTFFSPDDLNMIYLAPALRRRYFDTVLSQVDRFYLNDLLKLKKILKNRNQILRSINNQKSSTEELFFWNEKLIRIGANIVQKRAALVSFYNNHISSVYSNIAREEFNFRLKYVSNMNHLNEDKLHKELEGRLPRDLAMESTSLGPHRDDLIFLLNDKEMQYFSSRGEIRSAVLSLKLTELDFFRNQKNIHPILLLDDVFSELDEIRKEKLLELIDDKFVIITTTEKEKFLDTKDAVFWDMGKI